DQREGNDDRNEDRSKRHRSNVSELFGSAFAFIRERWTLPETSTHSSALGDAVMAARARRSASAFNGPSNIHRITMMPGDAKDQYRRNFARAVGLVVATRVSVRKNDSAAPSES